MQARVRFMYGFLAVVGLVLAGRLFYLQVLNGSSYEAQALAEQLKKYEIPAERGRIYIRDGESGRVPVVLNETLPTLYADPRYVTDAAAAAAAIAGVMGGDVNEYQSLLSQSDRYYVVLAKKLSPAKAEAITKLDLNGVGLQDQVYRTYPEGSFAAQTLGFVNDEGLGQYGIEGALDDQLRGEPGLLKAVTDVRGIPLTASDDTVIKEPSNGDDVVLTIDRSVQEFVEGALERGVKNSRSKSGSVVVMNPKDGSIVAMANYPKFDPAKFNKVKDASTFINGVVSTPYEIGSVIKAFTMSTALEIGAVEPDSTYYDAGFVQVGDRRIENAIAQVPADRTMTDVIEQSLNTGVVHALKQIGGGEINDQAENILYDYFVNKFGLSQLTGVEQTAEAPGVIYSPNDDEGNAVRYANMTFGQGMTLTMLQVASGFCALVNGGNYYQPYLVQARVDPLTGEEVVTQPKIVRSSVISKSTSQKIRRMMEAGVKAAGTSGGYREEYRIGGKTGTSQKLQTDGTYSDYLEIGSFAGFGADDTPQYVIMTKVDEPAIGGFAGSVGARPIFAEISNFLIDYYRIAPVR